MHLNQSKEEFITTSEIILVDDNESLLLNVSDFLSLFYKKVHVFQDPTKVVSLINDEFPGVLITDIRMPKLDGISLLKRVISIDDAMPVIMMTAHGDVSQAVEAMKFGGYDFIEKPFDPERLKEAVDRAIEKRFLTLSQRALMRQLANPNSIEHRLIGASAAMHRLRQDVMRVASMDVPVLIHGETGSGKEVVAGCIHENSQRNKANFVAINCAAIPPDLVESELFGHVKGAFSGAQSNRVGKLEYANGGTLFLDEVESIPMAVQIKLLRALSEGVIEPLGSNERREIDIRVVSAAKDELRDNDNFRQDLYFRLQVAEINIPPLRNRLEDIVILFEHYAKQFSEKSKIPWPGASPELQYQLMNYNWPGNVRELVNLATRCVMQEKQCIDELKDNTDPSDAGESDRSLKIRVNKYEKAEIIESLKRHHGNTSEVLNELGLEKRTFYLKLQKYSIDRKAFLSDD